MREGDIAAVEADAIANAANDRLWMGAGVAAARWVIHGAVMGQDLRTDAALVRSTTRSCLTLADELGCASLALPAFGTGVGGFALAECARIMVEEAVVFEPVSLRRVIFAVYGEEARLAFESAVAKL